MPAPKNYIKIQYPRKCNHCEYVSNNPQMWHYHNKTHDSIPDGQLCDHGCGKPALFRGTGGKYRCLAVSQHCPKYLINHSLRVKDQWSDPSSSQRKEDTKRSIIERLHNNETVEKAKKTKKQKQLAAGNAEDVSDDFRRYSKLIRRRGARARKKWAKSLGYDIGKHTYHIDHKLSVRDAWKAGLSEHIVNHPMNLQIVESKQNLIKGSKSSITVEELLELIRASV